MAVRALRRARDLALAASGECTAALEALDRDGAPAAIARAERAATALRVQLQLASDELADGGS